MAHRAAKCVQRASRPAAERAAAAEGVPLAPPTPAQLKMQGKKIAAKLAHMRVKLGEVGVQRMQLLARRAEALAGGGGAPPAPAAAPEEEAAAAADAEAAALPAPPAAPTAKDRLQQAKRGLKVMRVDAQLAALEVKAQRFVRWAPRGFAPRPGPVPKNAPHPPPPAPTSHPPKTQRNKVEHLRGRRAALAPTEDVAAVEEA